MMTKDCWLLPEGIEEVLPPAAGRLEGLRHTLLEMYGRWGYELVIPPLIEFLESLLTGAGDDLALQTFKLTDQISGRLMGVRADMTPQVARMDAHRIQRVGPTRLCYMGPVLRTRGDGFGGSRSPYQAGVELYGHSGYESDREVLTLLLETLTVAGIRDVHLDVGHVGIFQALVRQAQLSSTQEAWLFHALQRKALPEIHQQLADWALPTQHRDPLLALSELNGDPSVLDEAAVRLAATGAEVGAALTTLKQLVAAVQTSWPTLPIHIDLSELRGYHYHTGVVFATYVPGHGQAIAQGGRYDEIGHVFGRARPATGFSTDLATLLLLGTTTTPPSMGIYAPALTDAALDQQIVALRTQGERVVHALPGAEVDPNDVGCDRVLVRREGIWRIETIDHADTILE